MADLPAFGTAPIRCGRSRCSWRGFETDLAKVPGRMGGISCTKSVCPTCAHDSYQFMNEREIQAWKASKEAQPATTKGA